MLAHSKETGSDNGGKPKPPRAKSQLVVVDDDQLPKDGNGGGKCC